MLPLADCAGRRLSKVGAALCELVWELGLGRLWIRDLVFVGLYI